MPFIENNGLRYFQFDGLDVHHAVFTRHGGVSPGPWHSLNVGGTVGDASDNVIQNRLLSFKTMGCEPESIFDVWQVHGIGVQYGDNPRDLSEPYRKADIILTNNPEVTLFMRFADCVPILVHDPNKNVVGVSHAGWMGTVQNVAGATILAMHDRYGSEPSDVIACIGPSIGPDHYEVGENVIERVNELFGKNSNSVLHSVGHKTHFDLWDSNRLLLEQAGVKNIIQSGICTACHTEDWYSHRLEKGRTGRFGVLMSLSSRL